MFNFQKLPIFYLLLIAAVLVSTSSGAYVTIEKRFHNFKDLVKNIADSGPLSPNYTYKYHQIDRLNEVEHDIKLLCLKNFETKLQYEKKYYPSRVNEANIQIYAYKALDQVCKDVVSDIKSTIKTHTDKIAWDFDSMLKKGNIIQFLCHKNYPKVTAEKMKSNIKLLKRTYEDMSIEEAELWAIINAYDKGILKNCWPVPKSSPFFR